MMGKKFHKLKNLAAIVALLFTLSSAHAPIVLAEGGGDENQQQQQQSGPVSDVFNTMQDAADSATAGAQANADEIDNDDPDNQEQAQDRAKTNKSKGSKMATMLGMGLLAAGTVMVVAGQLRIQAGEAQVAAMNPYGTVMIGEGGVMTKAGLFTMAGGGAALLAGMMMGQNAGTGAGYQSNLGDLSNFPNPDNPGFNVDDGTPGASTNGNTPGGPPGTNAGAPGGGSSVEIDPEELRNGTLGEIFDKFEADTGISREDFSRAIQAGVPPSEILKGVGGLTSEQIQAGIDAANASNDFGGAGGLGSSMLDAAKEAGLGQLAEELQANLDKPGDGGADYEGGGGRGLAGASKAPVKKFDFNSLKEPKTMEKKYDLAKVDFDDLSDQVKAQLLKEGRTGISLFDMISQQYRKKTPLLFGQDPDIVLEGKYNPDKLDDEDVFNDI